MIKNVLIALLVIGGAFAVNAGDLEKSKVDSGLKFAENAQAKDSADQSGTSVVDVRDIVMEAQKADLAPAMAPAPRETKETPLPHSQKPAEGPAKDIGTVVLVGVGLYLLFRRGGTYSYSSGGSDDEL